MNKNKQLANFKPAKTAVQRVSAYNRKFYGLVTVGGLVSFGTFAYWSAMGSAISKASTIGDVIARNSLATSTLWWIIAGGVIAAVTAFVLARHRSVTAGILGSGILLASIVMSLVMSTPLHVSSDDQTAITYQTLDWDNPVWEDTQKNVYKDVFTPRDSETFTSKEWYALSSEEQDALRIAEDGKITPGKEIVWRGQAAQLSDGSFLQQVGNKNVCLFASESALKAGTSKSCVDMTAPIDAYKTAGTVTLTGMPVVPPMVPAVAAFVPIALIGGLWDQKSKRKAELMAAGTSDSLLEERWVTAKADLDAITQKWGELCADPLSALDHSALLDVSQYRTKNFMTAHATATDFASIAGRHERTDKLVSEFESYVRETKLTWNEANRYSSQIGTDWMTPEDQKVANTVRGLLELAMDLNAPMAERANAAGKAQKLLKKLHSIALPEVSKLMLERISAKQIEAA